MYRGLELTSLWYEPHRWWQGFGSTGSFLKQRKKKRTIRLKVMSGTSRVSGTCSAPSLLFCSLSAQWFCLLLMHTWKTRCVIPLNRQAYVTARTQPSKQEQQSSLASLIYTAGGDSVPAAIKDPHGQEGTAGSRAYRVPVGNKLPHSTSLVSKDGRGYFIKALIICCHVDFF